MAVFTSKLWSNWLILKISASFLMLCVYRNWKFLFCITLVCLKCIQWIKHDNESESKWWKNLKPVCSKLIFCCSFIFNIDVSSQKNLRLTPIYSSYFQKQNSSQKNTIFSIVPMRFLQFVSAKYLIVFNLTFCHLFYLQAAIISKDGINNA